MKKIVIFSIFVLSLLFTKDFSQAAEKITFGSYPQSEITGDALTSTISEASYDTSGRTTIGGVTYYKLTWKYDSKGNKVQLDRPRYFKCEPITWNLILKSNGEGKLIAERALDACIYSGADSPDYSSSYLKKWIEDNFYEVAFTAEEKKSIIANTKAAPPSFADMISVSYGFTSNTDRCIVSTDFADCISGKSHPQTASYWIQAGYIGSDGSTNSIVAGKGVYNSLLYVMPSIRVYDTVLPTVTVSPEPTTSKSPLPSGVSTQGAVSTPVYVKVKNTGKQKQKVSWGKSGDAEKYIILQSTSKNGNYKEIGSTKKASFIAKKLVIGKQYYYKVIAVKENMQSIPSKIVSKKAGIPNKPSLILTKSQKGLICKWSNLTRAQGIEIYYKLNKSSFSRLYKGALTGKTKKGCILHPANAAGKMYVKIRTYNKAGTKKYYSPYSRTASIRL